MQKSEKEQLKTQLAKAWLWIVGMFFVCGYVLAWMYHPTIATGITIGIVLFVPAGITGWAISQVVIAREAYKEEKRKQNNKV